MEPTYDQVKEAVRGGKVRELIAHITANQSESWRAVVEAASLPSVVRGWTWNASASL